ncbi:glutamate 5-kinase, partial [bacterium]|nr:glutamate 5-kinase [bacterium]
MERDFSKARRIVVKVGSSLLTEKNRLNLKRIEEIVDQLASLQKENKEVILVTSGAIAGGMGRLNLKKLITIPQKQAAAAIGQNLLMGIYERLFKKRGCLVAQVLLTSEDIQNRKRYLNARNTLLTLLNYKAIPIVNENDTVAVGEIKFGDNDTLSALVASKVEADLLIILTDTKGLYTADPKRRKGVRFTQPRRAGAGFVGEVSEITPQLERMASGPGTLKGTGGMVTKLRAAKIARSSGVAMVIADGRMRNVLLKVLAGERLGTLFLPKERLKSRKKWIAFGVILKGKIRVDKGAREAISKRGKSLLPSGIIEAKGRFSIGD